jgi:hypothetical protein
MRAHLVKKTIEEIIKKTKNQIIIRVRILAFGGILGVS